MKTWIKEDCKIQYNQRDISNVYLKPELLKKYFGYYETHEIETQDGYFITTYRIPKEKPKGYILFRHPATTDSVAWIIQGFESPALYFWKNGFEVWMTNTRGTDFSTKHKNLTAHDYNFWNFSFHEIALYDLGAALEYIYQRNNNNKIIVVGHSMGSTECLIYASMLPLKSKKYVHVFVLMTASTTFQFSRVNFLGNFIPFLQKLTTDDTVGVVLNKGSLMSRIVRSVCPLVPDLCIALYSFFGAGWSTEEPNPVETSIIFNQIPRALSVKCVLHYGQLISSGKFQMFDYGTANNEVYGSSYPPEYPVENIVTPIYLIVGSRDDLAPKEDTEAFYNKLPNIAKIYGKLNIEGMNHIDPIVGTNRKEKVYDKILNILNKLS
ncbi:hypothetical protein WA026_003813 [Henosepilachna vigintioctopunctata]|uniref:Lipase n=1 Tax=Henosepilachna vigintioctopunctata TaxID=420089 RepID=A0AAW1UEB4_9CUCU